MTGQGVARLLRPVPVRAFVAALVLYLVLRAVLAALPGYQDDLGWYKRWALAAAHAGLPAAYEVTNVDYPPVLLYPMYLAGEAYLFFEPDATQASAARSRAFTFLIKMPHLVFDLALAWILYAVVARAGLWGSSKADPGWGRLAALVYLWNPAVLWDSAYWGQPDGVHSAFAVGAIGLVGLSRWAGSGAAIGLALLTKPLAAPLVPLFGWAVAAGRGARGLVLAFAGAVGAAFLVFAPFLFTGRLVPVALKVLSDVEAMPLTSVNAHNLWWLLGPWRDANLPLWGPVAPKAAGLACFGLAYVVLLVRVHRGRSFLSEDERRAGLFLAAAAVTASFFLLSTHLHENHLFMAVPMLLAVAGRNRSLAWLAAGCSLAVLVNTVLHDPVLPYSLPSFLGAESGILDPYLQRPYTWLQLVGSFANALLVTTVTAGTYLAAWRAYRPVGGAPVS